MFLAEESWNWKALWAGGPDTASEPEVLTGNLLAFLSAVPTLRLGGKRFLRQES